jgi:hypothetical protein
MLAPRKRNPAAFDQVARLARLLFQLLEVAYEADPAELACGTEPETWTPENWRGREDHRYCGCLRCDIVLVERYLYRVWGRDYAGPLDEAPRPIHIGAMAVTDYIAASHACRRPFGLRGLKAHLSLCLKCRASTVKRGGELKTYAATQVKEFLARIPA